MTEPAHYFAGTRSVSRKLALQALYRWQLNDGPWHAAHPSGSDSPITTGVPFSSGNDATSRNPSSTVRR